MAGTDGYPIHIWWMPVRRNGPSGSNAKVGGRCEFLGTGRWIHDIE